MNSIICPTVLADNPHGFKDQVERVASFAERIQIDLGDGEFTARTIAPTQVWWPENLQVDIHLMFARPIEHIETLVSLKPRMIILHAESGGDLAAMIEHLQKIGIKTGLAILPETTVESVEYLVEMVDHVLIFAGKLGSFGGNADLVQLDKVAQIRAIKPEIETGWDGGANLENAAKLSVGGIDVINVGSAIQRAADPVLAYEQLTAAIG